MISALRNAFICKLLLLFALSSSFSVQAQTALGLETAEFLPVEQAYRLDVAFGQKEHELQFVWLLEDTYFLYKHGFKLQWHWADADVKKLEGSTLNLPEGLEKDDEYFGLVETYYQQVNFFQPFTAPAADAALYLQASSQGCADAGLCYPPYHLYYLIDFQNQTVSVISAEEYASAQIVKTAIDAPVEVDSIDSLSQFLGILFAAFLGGLILNLMPCVLPVLSIKVMQLARHHDVKSTRQQGLAYLLGVVLSFLAVAALMLSIRSSGNAVGWGFQLQNPVFVAALVYLFFALALGMSGYVAFGQRWMGAGQALTERSGMQGSFFTGVLAVIVASPCTAPFMGGALGYALTEPAAIGLSIFAALGVGMALPITLVSFIPAASAWLPKPGLWMERLKQFFAFPLFATAVWLLWVLGNQSSTLAMALMMLGCIALVFGFWCFKSQKAISRVAGLISFLIALMLPFSDVLQKRSGQLDASYVEFTQAELDSLRAQGIPVFIDLTADWCITCIANEQTTLNNDEVQQAFKDAGIVYMVGDWTYPNPEITALLSEHHRSGIPLYLLYPPITDAPAIILPQVLSTAIILDAIKSIK